MKKRLICVLALLLALTQFAGCSLRPVSLSDTLEEKLSGLFDGTPGASGEDGDLVRNPDGLTFSQMRYVRPDVDTLSADVAAVMDALERGAGLEEVEALLDVCMDDFDHFDTMYSLANIYNCKDLRDEYYAAEYEWCSSQSSSVSQKFDRMYYACAGSPLGAELEEDYFWEGFCEEYADPNDSYYTDETVALMQRESELVSRYREIVADPVVTYRGEERSFYELLDELSGYAYLTVLQQYYTSYNERLAEVYIDLMRVRCEMAEAMGFESCEAMEYDFFFGRDYTPEDAALFIEDVKTYLVPLYSWADERGIGYDLNAASLSNDALHDGIRSVAGSIGGDCLEAYEFMMRYELCDTEASPYKSDTSFETYLDDYECPFVFIKPTGKTADLLTFVHEFGHFTDAYVNYNASETIDLAECFSQGLEFLSLWHLDGVLDEKEIDKLRLSQMIDALNTFIQQCAFAEFESMAHALPPEELNAQKLNELALKSAKDFGMCPDGLEIYYQYYWMDITHFFEYPFYVISYPVSLDIAMQLYDLELEEEGKGLAKYFEILPRDYDTFLETVENGGLTSPFTEGGIRSVAAAIAETIGYDRPIADAA